MAFSVRFQRILLESGLGGEVQSTIFRDLNAHAVIGAVGNDHGPHVEALV